MQPPNREETEKQNKPNCALQLNLFLKWHKCFGRFNTGQWGWLQIGSWIKIHDESSLFVKRQFVLIQNEPHMPVSAHCGIVPMEVGFSKFITLVSSWKFIILETPWTMNLHELYFALCPSLQRVNAVKQSA